MWQRPFLYVQAFGKLENNEFVQKNVPSTFLRGYVRSYAKFLRIPDAEWAHLTFGEAQ